MIDLEKRSSWEENALGIAASYCDLELVKLLVEGGADIHAVDTSGFTLLHLAAYFAKHEIAKYLVEQGIDTEAEDENGDTPLDIVSFNAYYYYYEVTDDIMEIYG